MPNGHSGHRFQGTQNGLTPVFAGLAAARVLLVGCASVAGPLEAAPLAGQPFVVQDEQTIYSLQWGEDARFAPAGRPFDYTDDGQALDVYASLLYIEYESDVLSERTSAGALLSTLRTESYGGRIGLRVRAPERLMFPAADAELGLLNGDRDGLRFGGFVGYFIQSGRTCAMFCVGGGVTVGGFYDESDLSIENATTTLGSDESRLRGEFETVFHRWRGEATASLFLKF